MRTRFVLLSFVVVFCGCGGAGEGVGGGAPPDSVPPVDPVTPIATPDYTLDSDRTDNSGAVDLTIAGHKRRIRFLDEQSEEAVPGLEIRSVEDGARAAALVVDPAGEYAPRFVALTNDGAAGVSTYSPSGKETQLVGTIRDRILLPALTRLQGEEPRSLDYIDSALIRFLVRTFFELRERVALRELRGTLLRTFAEFGGELVATWLARVGGLIGSSGITEAILWALTGAEFADALMIEFQIWLLECHCYQANDEVEVWNFRGFPGGTSMVGVMVLPVGPPSGSADQTLGLGGVVRDSRTGSPLANATVTVTPGGRTTTTNGSGSYSFGLVPVGCEGVVGVRLVASKAGYERVAFDGDSMGLSAYASNQFNFSLNPAVQAGSGDIRIVLDWGAEPRDLDSHLYTPSGAHVYYSSRGSTSGYPYAALDVDDTSGYGPETITIASFESGTYAYWVYRYAGTGNIGGSGARVRVFDELGEITSVRAPQVSSSARWWHVLDVNGATGAVTVVNTLHTSGGP